MNLSVDLLREVGALEWQGRGSEYSLALYSCTTDVALKLASLIAKDIQKFVLCFITSAGCNSQEMHCGSITTNRTKSDVCFFTCHDLSWAGGPEEPHQEAMKWVVPSLYMQVVTVSSSCRKSSVSNPFGIGRMFL